VLRYRPDERGFVGLPEWLSDQRVAVTGAVPSMLDPLVSAARGAGLPSLNYLSIGSERLTRSSAEAVRLLLRQAEMARRPLPESPVSVAGAPKAAFLLVREVRLEILLAFVDFVHRFLRPCACPPSHRSRASLPPSDRPVSRRMHPMAVAIWLAASELRAYDIGSMCTLVILRRPDHAWPVILAANREQLDGLSKNTGLLFLEPREISCLDAPLDFGVPRERPCPGAWGINKDTVKRGRKGQTASGVENGSGTY